MAKADNNSGDGYSGRVGNTVYYKRMGKWVKRTIGKSNKPASLAQLKHRQRVKITNKFIAPVKEFIEISLAPEGRVLQRTPNDLMLKYTLGIAITGEYPNQEIDFTKAQFSAGNMKPTPALKITQNDAGLRFSWDTALIPDEFRNDDQVLLLIYFPELEKADFQTTGISRSDGSYQFNVPKNDSATKMETYISFISANRKRVSPSSYLGQFILPAYQPQIK